jgi:hypothetical protein
VRKDLFEHYLIGKPMAKLIDAEDLMRELVDLKQLNPHTTAMRGFNEGLQWAIDHVRFKKDRTVQQPPSQ